MSIERLFLGWRRPALHLAAEFLYDEFHRNSRWDMSSVIVALPGGRAGRRLQELLAIQAGSLSEAGERIVLIPPHITTVGELPEILYAPRQPVATDLEALLAWTEALRRVPAKAILPLFPGAPREPDTLTLCSLASEIAAIDLELSAECISCGDLQAYCSGRGQEASAARWRAFAQVQSRFLDVLRERGRISCNQARTEALSRGSLRGDKVIVLVAAPDLPAITRKILDESPARVVALIHAPKDAADGFDKTAQLVSSYWAETGIDLPERNLEIVDYPRDQALAVAQTLQRQPDLNADTVAVGVCQESLGAPIERAIEAIGKRAHRATGMRISSSGPAQLLSVLSAYLLDHQAERFAALIRHPDLNDYLVRILDWPDPAGQWPQLCDRYIADHLPAEIGSETKKLPTELALVVGAVEELTGGDKGSRQPLAACAEKIAGILGRVYTEAIDQESPGGAALDLLNSALTDLSLSARNDALRLSLTEAIGFLLSTYGGQTIPAPAGGPQIDLIGWLETHLDDSPALILAGFNEGAVPESVLGDAFLPDSLRADLGLLDNYRRYARDAYLLRAILASRQMVHVVCGRYGVQNELLAPSRLVLACSSEVVARRILAFYGEREGVESPTSDAAYRLAGIPRPRRATKPLSSMRVTAFRDYLACPYRFYLKYVLGLKAVEDCYVEMGPDAFGNLLHGVLQDFGRWVRAEKNGHSPADTKMISDFLRDSLGRRARDRFGEPMHPAVAIQVELLGRRLEAFARFQAAEADSGWIILATERTLNAELDIDGAPFRIQGRIDRIDYHPGHGLYRVLDYKSRDGGCDPETSHRNADGWTDLQLPLYRRLAALIDIEGQIDERSVEVGYIALPKDLKKIGYVAAPWSEDEFYEAYMLSDDIIRRVRAQEFWPPSLTPLAFDDGYSAICLDTTLDRQAIIERDSGAEAVWPDRVSVEAAHDA